jgi:hypothetical protein
MQCDGCNVRRPWPDFYRAAATGRDGAMGRRANNAAEISPWRLASACCPTEPLPPSKRKQISPLMPRSGPVAPPVTLAVPRPGNSAHSPLSGPRFIPERALSCCGTSAYRRSWRLRTTADGARHAPIAQATPCSGQAKTSDRAAVTRTHVVTALEPSARNPEHGFTPLCPPGNEHAPAHAASPGFERFHPLLSPAHTDRRYSLRPRQCTRHRQNRPDCTVRRRRLQPSRRPAARKGDKPL